MEVCGGQPWKARARSSRHWTIGSRGRRDFSESRMEGSWDSRPALKMVEGW